VRQLPRGVFLATLAPQKRDDGRVVSIAQFAERRAGLRRLPRADRTSVQRVVWNACVPVVITASVRNSYTMGC
jgi:hypothetical protein